MWILRIRNNGWNLVYTTNLCSPLKIKKEKKKKNLPVTEEKYFYFHLATVGHLLGPLEHVREELSLVHPYTPPSELCQAVLRIRDVYPGS